MVIAFHLHIISPSRTREVFCALDASVRRLGLRMNASFPQRAGPGFWIIWAALGLCLGAAFFQGPMLPLRDLPDHLALISLLDHSQVPGSLASEHYLIQWTPVPYWLFYGSVWLFARVMDYLTAVQWVLLVTLMVTPIALGRLFAVCGRDGRWALLSMPLFFNHNLMWGWVSYCMAIPVLAMALASLVQLSRERASPWPLAGWSCLLFLAHAQLALYFAVLVGLRLALLRSSQAVRCLLPLMAPVVLGLPWLVSRFFGIHGRGETVTGDALIFHDPVTRMKRLADHMTNCYSGSLDDWLWLASVLAIVGLILLNRQKKDSPDSMVVTLVLSAVVLYFIAPWEVRWPLSQWSIYSRFAILALLFAPGLIPGSYPGTTGQRLLILTWLVVVLAFARHNREVYRDFNHRNGWVLKAVDALPENLFIAPLVFDAHDKASHLGAADQFHAYYVVRRGGYDPYLFDNPSHPVIHRQDVKPKLPPWNRPMDFKRWSKKPRSAKSPPVDLVMEQFDRSRLGQLSGFGPPRSLGRWMVHRRGEKP